MLTFILFIGLSQIEVVYADKSRNLEDVNKDISKVEKEIIKATDEINSINEQIESTEALIQQNENKIKIRESEIEELNDEVDKLNDEIAKLEEQIEIRNEILANRLRSLQVSGGQESYIEVLLGSTDFQSFISRMHASKTIMEADSTLIKSQEEDVMQVERNKILINSKLEDAEKVKEELEEVRKENEDKKEELIKNKKTVESKQKDLKKKKNAYVKEGNDIKALEEKMRLKAKQEAEARQKAAEAQQKSNSTLETKSFSTSKSGETFTMEATAYTAECKGCSGITATGLNLNKNRNMKVIAVDPNVIPLGSKVWVEGYGEAIAGDTGGDIKGNRIDLHFPNKGSALAFGRKNVTVRVLN